jgi:hypothetical protein
MCNGDLEFYTAVGQGRPGIKQKKEAKTGQQRRKNGTVTERLSQRTAVFP